MQRVNLYTRGIRFKGPVLKVRYDGIKLFNALAPRRGYFTGVHFLQRDDSLQMDTVMSFDVQAMHPVTIYTGPQRRPCPTHFRLSRPPWPLHISHIVCTPLPSHTWSNFRPTRHAHASAKQPNIYHSPTRNSISKVTSHFYASHFTLLSRTHMQPVTSQRLSSRKLPGYAIHSFSSSFF